MLKYSFIPHIDNFQYISGKIPILITAPHYFCTYSEEEKKELKRKLESQQNPQELIKTLAKEAGLETLTEKDIQRILKSPLRILSRQERRLRQELQEIIKKGGYQYLSRESKIRGPSEEVGESGIESQSFIETPPEKTPPRKTRRYRKPPEEEI